MKETSRFLWMGEPIEGFSKEKLIEILKLTIRQKEMQEERHHKNLDSLSSLRKGKDES